MWKLQENALTKSDLVKLTKYILKTKKLTQGKEVIKFEKQFSKWNKSKYSIFVNSGSSANLLIVSAAKELFKWKSSAEIIVPSLTWPTTVNPVIQSGLKPIFLDTNFYDLSINYEELKKKINKNTKAIFLSYIQGFNCLTEKLLKVLKKKKIHLIEDVCESHGAKFKNKKLGSFGWTSSFSFYYAHHMSTIEGGMICTDDKKTYHNLLMLRSHGMVREVKDNKFQKYIKNKYKDLNTKFIFKFPAYNVRNTEIGGVLGLEQIKRLDKNIAIRNKNFEYFINQLDKNIFFTNFDLTGHSNYAFNVILKNKNRKLMNKILQNLEKKGIEFRRGSAGGGNQLRQPYLKDFVSKKDIKELKNTEHIHFFSFYVGNYPELTLKKIDKIVKTLNIVTI